MNKTKKLWLVAVPMAFMLGACSTFGSKGASSDQLSSTGPSIVSVTTKPSTFELNQSWQPMAPAKVIAQVKDFTSNISEVRIRFSLVPLQIQMNHVGGTTWEATLTPQQLQTLAVGGETIKYQANIIARNEDGLITVSPSSLAINVKAPIPTTRASFDRPEQAGQAALEHSDSTAR